MFCYLHVGVRCGGHQTEPPLLVVDEKQEEEEKGEVETIFQENLKSTKGQISQSHGFGLHRNLTNQLQIYVYSLCSQCIISSVINLSFEVWLIFFCSIARKVVLHKNGKSNNPVYKNRRMYCTSLHDNSILGPSLGSCLCNKNLHQQGKSVAKYIFFLSNLLNTIG